MLGELKRMLGGLPGYGWGDWRQPLWLQTAATMWPLVVGLVLACAIIGFSR